MSADEIVSFGVRSFTTESGFIKIYKDGNEYFIKCKLLISTRGTAVAQWLRCCATNWKVAGSIPTSVGGFFIDIKSFRSHYGPGVDSASN